jgi:hypothetical protein
MKYSGYVVLNTKNKRLKFIDMSKCTGMFSSKPSFFGRRFEAELALRDEISDRPHLKSVLKIVPAHVIVKEK